MEDFKNLAQKLEPFKNRFANPTVVLEKTLLNKEENELIVNCCKSISEIIISSDSLNKNDTGKLIKESLELMFIMTNHENDSIRIVICKYIFKTIKFFLKAYRRFIFHSIIKTINHGLVESSRWALYTLTVVAHSTGQEYRRIVARAAFKPFLNLFSRIEDIGLHSTICETAPDLLKYFGNSFETHEIENLINNSINNILTMKTSENTVVRSAVTIVQHACINARSVFLSVFYSFTVIIKNFNNELEMFKISSLFRILNGLFQVLVDTEFNQTDEYSEPLVTSMTEDGFESFLSFLEANSQVFVDNRLFNGTLIFVYLTKILLIGLSYNEKHVLESGLMAFTTFLKIKADIISLLLKNNDLLCRVFCQINKRTFPPSVYPFNPVPSDNNSEMQSAILRTKHHRTQSSTSIDFDYSVGDTISITEISFANRQASELEDSDLLPDTIPTLMLNNELNESFDDDQFNKTNSTNDFFVLKLNSFIYNEQPYSLIKILTAFSMSIIISYSNGNTVYDKSFSSSTQILAIEFLTSVVENHPEMTHISLLFKEIEQNFYVSDLFSLIKSSGIDCSIISSIISLASEFFSSLTSLIGLNICEWERLFIQKYNTNFFLGSLLSSLASYNDESDLTILKSIIKFYQKTGNILLIQPDYHKYVIDFVHMIITISMSREPVLNIEILEFFGALNYRLIKHIQENWLKNDRKILMRRNLFEIIQSVILRMVASADSRIHNSAISCLLGSILSIPIPNESQTQSISRIFDYGFFIKCKEFLSLKNVKNVVPSFEWLSLSVSNLISTVISVLASSTKKDIIINYCSCLVEIGLVYSPMLLPSCWGVKNFDEWKNSCEIDQINLLSLLFELLTTNLDLASNVMLHVSLLKLAVECLGGSLVKQNEESFVNLTNSSKPLHRYWEQLFDHISSITSILTFIVVDKRYIQFQKQTLLECDFFKGKNKPNFNTINFPNTLDAKNFNDIITRQIKVIFETHTISLSKFENEKFTALGVLILHCVELILMCSTYEYLSSKFFNLFLNLLCLSTRFPLASSLCIKQLIYIFTPPSKWFSLFRLNDCSEFYVADKCFMEDPEFFLHLKFKSRAVSYFIANDSDTTSLNIKKSQLDLNICVKSIPSIPLITSDRFDTPSLGIFSNFISLCFKHYYSHYSMAFHSLTLDIIELFVCMQVNYQLLDPGSTFLKLTISKFREFLKTPNNISPYFANRVFRYWNLFNNILSLNESLLDDVWRESLKSTDMKSLMALISDLITDQNPSTGNVLASIEALIHHLTYVDLKIEKNTGDLRSKIDNKSIFDILFQKCYSHLRTYQIIHKILVRCCTHNDESCPSIYTYIYKNIIKLLKNEQIPVENGKFFTSLNRIYGLYGFTTMNKINELKPFILDPLLFQKLDSQCLSLRNLAVTALTFKWFFESPDDDNLKLDKNYKNFINTIYHGKLDISIPYVQFKLILFGKLFKALVDSNTKDNFFSACIIDILNNFIKLLFETHVCEHTNACDIICASFSDINFDKLIYETEVIISFFKFTCALHSYCSRVFPIKFYSNLLIIGDYFDSCQSMILMEPRKGEMVSQPYDVLNVVYKICNEPIQHEYYEYLQLFCNKLKNSTWDADFINFVNKPTFNVYKLVNFLKVINQILPEQFFNFFSNIDHVKWIDLPESIPVIMELDQYLIELRETNPCSFNKISVHLTIRFKFIWEKISKTSIDSHNKNINDYVLNEVLFCSGFMDEILSVFPMIRKMNKDELVMFLDSRQLTSFSVANLIISNFMTRMPTYMSDHSQDSQPNCENIFLVLKWAFLPVQKFVKNVVVEIMNLDIPLTISDHIESIHTKLIYIISNSEANDINSIIRICQTVIMPKAMLGIEDNYLRIKFREIYLFSLFLASLPVILNPIRISILIDALNLLSLSLRIYENINDYNKIEIALLSMCIKNCHDYFVSTSFNFDSKFSLELFNACDFNKNENSFYYLSYCYLSYLSLELSYINLQNYESCSIIKLQTSQTFPPFTHSFLSFVYNVSRHKIFSSFVRAPHRLLPQLLSTINKDAHDDFIDIPYIPVKMFTKHKYVKELIIRFLKLGWTSKKMLMECIMVLLNLLNIYNDDNCQITKKPTKFLMTISRGITELLRYTLSIPHIGDPMFSKSYFSPIFLPKHTENSDPEKTLIKLNKKIPNQFVYKLVYSWECLFRQWNRCYTFFDSFINTHTSESDDKNCDLSKTPEFLFKGSLEHFYWSNDGNVNQQRFDLIYSNLSSFNRFKNGDWNCSLSMLNYIVSSLDIIPVIKLMLEFYFSALDGMQNKYAGSIYKHNLMKYLLFITDFITESQDFERILNILMSHNSDDYMDDYISLKYFILLASKSLSIVGYHKICKTFVSNFEFAFNHPRSCVRISSYISLFNIIPHRSHMLTNIKNKILNNILIKIKSPDMLNYSGSLCEKFHLITISTYILLNENFSPSLIGEFISNLLKLVVDFSSTNTNFLLLKIIWFSLFHICILNNPSTHVFDKLISTTFNQISQTNSYVEMTKLYLLNSVHGLKSNSSRDPGQYIEDSCSLIKKIALFDLSVSENFSRILCILMEKLIDVENIVNPIISIMFKDEHKIHIFIFLLFKVCISFNKKIIKRFHSLNGRARSTVWLVYSLSILKQLPFEFTYKMELGNQLMSIFLCPSSPSMFYLSTKGPKNVDFLKKISNHLINMIYNSILGEKDKIEFTEAITNLCNVN